MQNENFENGLRQNEITLNEIKAKIEHYQMFEESLEEIALKLGLNTGTHLMLQQLYIERQLEVERVYNKFYKLRSDDLRDDKILSDILLAMYMRAHEKIGEISFLLESSIETCEQMESEILHNMECTENSKHFEDFMNEPQ